MQCTLKEYAIMLPVYAILDSAKRLVQAEVERDNLCPKLGVTTIT